jgi:hypothetical protein
MKIIAKRTYNKNYCALSEDGKLVISFGYKNHYPYKVSQDVEFFHTLESGLEEIEVEHTLLLSYYKGEGSAEYQRYKAEQEEKQRAINAANKARFDAEYATKKKKVLKLWELRKKAFSGQKAILYFVEFIEDYSENMGDPFDCSMQVHLNYEDALAAFESYKDMEPEIGNFSSVELHSFVVNDILDITDHTELDSPDLFFDAKHTTLLDSLSSDGKLLPEDGYVLTWQWKGYPGGYKKLINVEKPYVSNYYGYRLKYTSDLGRKGFESSFGTWQSYVDNMEELVDTIGEGNLEFAILKLNLDRADLENLIDDSWLEFYFQPDDEQEED